MCLYGVISSPGVRFSYVTMRNVKFKPKTSPKNANFCNKTNPIFFIKKASKKTTKKTTLKPINKGKFNDRKPLKKPVKEPVNLFTTKNNCIDYQLITKISKKRLKKICRFKINVYLYIKKTNKY